MPERTIAFPPVTARFFRVSWTAASTEKDYKIAELALMPGARVHHFEEKAGFATAPNLSGLATPPGAPGSAIEKSGIVDLTSKMHPDGTMDWTPPAGEWAVLRFGYSLTGARNSPASAEATGLEVDKLNHTYVKNYMDHYLNMYKEAVGPDLIGKKGLSYVITDSWEAANQNWTDDMISQFTKRRGYDPDPGCRYSRDEK